MTQKEQIEELRAELEETKARVSELEAEVYKPGLIMGTVNSVLNWTEFGYQWAKRSTGKLVHGTAAGMKAAARKALERGLAAVQ